MTTTATATRKRANRPCPNCGRSIATDLYIEANEKGFVKVPLGFKCKTCKSVHRNAVELVSKIWGVKL